MKRDDNTTLGTWTEGEGGAAGSDVEPARDRYTDRGLLGRGGMGEVRRVFDRELEREVAMKLLRTERLHASSIASFLQEARVHAGLQHPGIVPLHDLGRLPDGRMFFTMPVVRGRTLDDAIREGMGLPHLVAAFHQVCLTVAYAHDQGVLHRDLKPSNVMLGSFGEVLVLDWGIAQVREALEAPAGRTAIRGSPRFMAPEQARGENDRLGPATDVYGLGAILYEALAGRPPFAELREASEVLERVASGVAPTPPARIRAVPEELGLICARAMAPTPGDRYPSAADVAAAIAAWRDGVARRARAEQLVERARAHMEAAVASRARAEAAADQASDRLADLGIDATLDDKRVVWRLESQAEELARAADVGEAEALALLRAALSHDAETPEAHALLAGHFRSRHRAAEAAGARAAAAALEVHLRAHDRTGEHAAYLRSEAWLTLHTQPAGATVQLFRFEERDRQLVPVRVVELGRTPLDRVPIERGSWLCVCSLDGHLDVRVPIAVDRLEHWDGIRPGESEPHAIRLPRTGELGPEDCYVPAGWARLGGGSRDRQRGTTPLARVWVDGFVVRRHPFTNREMLDALGAIAQERGIGAALDCVPREGLGGEGAAIYALEGDRFVLKPDADGDLWEPDWPVFQVDWHAARTIATYLGWRLPTEWEWEKAARGVDGRRYPWGHHGEALFSRCRHSGAGPARVGEYPTDRSVYDVEGLAGNVMDWCLDDPMRGALPELHRVVEGSSSERPFRGGAWDHLPQKNASDLRFRNKTGFRHATVSFRLARTF